jgi:hypothetical protein
LRLVHHSLSKTFVFTINSTDGILPTDEKSFAMYVGGYYSEEKTGLSEAGSWDIALPGAIVARMIPSA